MEIEPKDALTLLAKIYLCVISSVLALSLGPLFLDEDSIVQFSLQL